MSVIRYQVTLQEPAMIAGIEGDPNSAVALDYVPGSALRGALIRRYTAGGRTFAAEEAQVRRLFLDGSTRFLNAYPVVEEQRSLPTPRSWRRAKNGDPGKVVELADLAVQPELEASPDWQTVKTPFCMVDDDGVGAVVKPSRHVAIHQLRSRRYGRPMPAETAGPGEPAGAIYRYDALAPRQTFEGIILCDDGEDAELLLSLLEGETALGKSRGAGYGRAVLHDAEIAVADDQWQEGQVGLEGGEPGVVVVTLLSHAIVRDEHGQHAVNEESVSRALFGERGMRPLRSFFQGELIGGFNRAWGLPLPQTLAVGMGSVFVYAAAAAGDAGQLRVLEWTGIGERRAEGFGRIAVNWRNHGVRQLSKDGGVTSDRLTWRHSDDLRRGTEAGELAALTAGRLQRQRLDQRLVTLAQRIRILRPPSNAQLGDLRQTVHNELLRDTPDPTQLGKALDRILERSAARTQFAVARVSGDGGVARLDSWLKRYAEPPNREQERQWVGLFGTDADNEVRVGAVRVRVTPELRGEYLLRLVALALTNAVKAQQGGERDLPDTEVGI